MNNTATILMADVVKSGTHDAAALGRHLNTTIKAANRSKPNGIMSPLTVTLGDEFQGVCQSVVHGVRTMLWLEHRLRAKPLVVDGQFDAYSLRYVLHQGTISTPINRDRAHGMLGPGLTRARYLLNQKDRSRPRFQIEVNDSTISRRLQIAFNVLDELGRDLKVTDYAFIEALLQESNSEKVAKKFGRHRTSVERRRRNLYIEAIKNTESLIYDLCQIP